MSGKGEEYKCEHCGEVFDKGWSDEEAAQEMNENFSKEELEHEGTSLICDDCYVKFMKYFNEEENGKKIHD